MNCNARDLPPLHTDERLDTVNEQIRLIQKSNGLTYGTDAYLLAAYAPPSPRACAVDLGSGTGIVPLLLLAQRKVASVTAVEIQAPFADLIARNARINGVSDRLHPLCADLREIDARTIGREVDLVFANPPYMRCDSGKRNEHDEKYIARHEVCGSIGDFCAAAGRLLRHGGKFFCVWRPDRLSELMRGLCAAKLEPKRMTFVHADEGSEPCMLLVEAVKGASPSLRMTPPLFLYRPQADAESTRTLTLQAQAAYDTGLFPDAYFPCKQTVKNTPKGENQ